MGTIVLEPNGVVRTAKSKDGIMPEIKIVTEVAGRVCALRVAAGGHVNEGDEVVMVEAMKMEIPASSPAAGTIKSMLVRLDDLVAEGQAIAVLETQVSSYCERRVTQTT